MDLFILLEDDIIVEHWVGHVLLDPFPLNRLLLLSAVPAALLEKLFWAKAQKEVTIGC